MFKVFCFLAFVSLSTLAFPSSARASGADISICNQADQKIRVTVLYQHWEGGSEMSWAEDGWYAVSPGNCRFIKTIRIGWAAFAFSVGQDSTFRPFTFVPSETSNRTGDEAPGFSSVCVTDYPGSFGRRGLRMDQVGTTCAQGATQVIPVSFKVYADTFTNTRVSINIDRIPGAHAARSAGAAPPPEDFHILGEVNSCQIVAAPSFLTTSIVSDGSQLSLDDIYDVYLSRAKAAISKYQRDLRCSEMQFLKGQFYPFITDDSGSTYQVFMYDQSNGIKPTASGRGYTTPGSDKIYQPQMFVLGIKRL